MRTSVASYTYLVIFLLLCSTLSAEIIISPDGVYPWDGNCTQTCDLVTPCRLLETAINTASDGPCIISFLGGNYPPQVNHRWTYPDSTSITLLFSRNTSNLNFLVNLGGGNLEMKASGAVAELIVSRLEFDVALGVPVNVSGIMFDDSMLIRRGLGQQVEIKYCLFSSFAFSSGFLSTVPISHLYLDIFRIEYQYHPTAPPSSALVRVNSTVTMNFEGFGYGTTLLSLSDTISINAASSSLTVVNSELTETHLINGGKTLSQLIIRSTTVESPVRSSVNAIEMQITDNSLIRNSEISSANLTLHSSILRNSVVTSRIFTTENGGLVSISGLVQMHPDCSLTTDYLQLNASSNLEIESLTVFRSIVSGATPGTITAMPATVSLWTFSSILVENSNLNARNLSNFRYLATDPTSGIVLTGSSSLRAQPDLVVVSWHFTEDPSIGVWYPLANQMVGRPGKLRAGPSLNARRLEIFSQINSGLLEYKLLPETCPPPPVGFVCVGGVWVADGSGNSTDSVIVPGNGGVVPVDGNLTVSGPIVFDGIGSYLNVSGCVNLTLVEVKIDLSKDVPSTPTVLIQQGKNCPISLGNTPVSVQETSDSCKKVSVKNAPSEADSLLVVFSVDSSGCSTWIWIVVGSVLGVIVVTAVVAVVIWKLWTAKFTRR